MSKVVNKATITAALASIIISSTKLIAMDENYEDAIQTVAPFVAHGLVAIAIWCFIKKGFETIDELRDKNLKTKLRKDINIDIDHLKDAIDSGHLTPEDEAEKRKELSDKYTELTNINVTSLSND